MVTYNIVVAVLAANHKVRQILYRHPSEALLIGCVRRHGWIGQGLTVVCCGGRIRAQNGLVETVLSLEEFHFLVARPVHFGSATKHYTGSHRPIRGVPTIRWKTSGSGWSPIRWRRERVRVRTPLLAVPMPYGAT